MKRRQASLSAGLLGEMTPAVIFLAVLVAPLGAHRLDEYLQAARVDIARNRIAVAIDLTPGVSVAPQVIAAIDANRDGTIAPAEANRYASFVLQALSLAVDGSPSTMAVASVTVPDVESLRQGVGAIRLQAQAPMPAVTAGRHVAAFRNMHRPEIGVYLANALVPTDAAITIVGQDRDVQQHELRISFDVAGERPASAGWRVTISAMMATALAAAVLYVGRNFRSAGTRRA